MLTPQNAILVPRWLLTVKYALFAVLGVTVFWTTAPAFVIVTGREYASWWAVALTIVAIVCLVTSLRPQWEPVETWAVSILTCLLAAYAAAPVALALAGDENRAAFSIIVITVTMLPALRAFALLRKVGRK